ncbi:GM18723 [Drosophila sechellia]|uniref:GM18723 n=1 Tax=Drosophila sechellia TaxID=7238 RepID=B4IN33_DROSE|nr:GM18723 [Drosophila sechellia]
MQQMDDPPSLPVGTEVSAKYKGAFCEAKVSKVVRNIKVKVAYKQGLGSGIVSDDAIKAPTGQLRVGAVVEVRHPDRKELVEATITKIQDCSQYTVVFDDGDITTLRRTGSNQWKLIAMRLGFTPCTVSVMNLVKQAYKKFLQPYGDFIRKLGCSC